MAISRIIMMKSLKRMGLVICLRRRVCIPNRASKPLFRAAHSPAFPISRCGSSWNNDLDWIGRLVQRAINPRAFRQDLNYPLAMDDWKDSIRLTIKDQNDAKA